MNLRQDSGFCDIDYEKTNKGEVKRAHFELLIKWTCGLTWLLYECAADVGYGIENSIKLLTDGPLMMMTASYMASSVKVVIRQGHNRESIRLEKGKGVRRDILKERCTLFQDATALISWSIEYRCSMVVCSIKLFWISTQGEYNFLAEVVGRIKLPLCGHNNTHTSWVCGEYPETWHGTLNLFSYWIN